MKNKVVKNQDTPVSKIFDFTKVKVENIEREIETVDVSKIIGNILYNSTPDIMAMDKAREIYHKGKADLSKKEATYYLNLLMESPAASAPLKVAMQDFFKFPEQTNNK